MSVSIRGPITRVYVTPGGDVSVYIDGKKKYYTLKKTHPGFEQIYSLMLLAAGYRYNIWLRLESETSTRVRYAVIDW